MEKRIEDVDRRLAKVESKLECHWALNTENDFAKIYVEKARNELQSTIFKMAIGAIVMLAGAGYVFIENAVNNTFSSKNDALIKKLESQYEKQVTRTNNNFEWRRFHDYGKDYVNLSELYSKSPITREEKIKSIHNLYNEADGYFNKALSHGDMHASTFYELGELRYSYPIEMDVIEEIDKLKAISYYKQASDLYTEIEIQKGWRAESYYKVGEVYFDLSDDNDVDLSNKGEYIKKAKSFLEKARDDYSKVPDTTDDRTKKNIKVIGELLAKIEKKAP